MFLTNPGTAYAANEKRTDSDIINDAIKGKTTLVRLGGSGETDICHSVVFNRRKKK